MPLLHICIEVRKNLGSANVFLQFYGSLTDNDFLKINLDANTLRLREFSTETRVDFSTYFDIDASTLCNLTVEERNASFRLCMKKVKKEMFEPISNTPTVGIVSAPHIPNEAALHCSNCLFELCASRCYARVLAYPTSSIDSNDFFCHGTINLNEKLVPRLEDMFYGFNFIVLNSNALLTATKIRDAQLYCKRCLQFLGDSLLNGQASKLWADAVRIRFRGEEEQNGIVEIYQNNTKATLTSQLIQFLLHEANLGLSMLQFYRVLIKTTFPNRQRRYLLMEILDSNLQVLRNRQPMVHGNNNVSNVLDIVLSAQKCCKLYFMLLKDTLLLAQRQNGVVNCEHSLSPSMFSTLLQQLKYNAQLIPIVYQQMAPKGFQASYVFYDFDYRD